MSGQHWIDELFRKRMERQDFPVEEGEFEEVRALLRERNSTTGAVGGGGISKWWLSALLPMAGLLWWAYGGNAARADDRVPPTTADRRIPDTDGAGQNVNGANSTTAQAQLDPSFAAVGTGPDAHVLPVSDTRTQTAPVEHERRSGGLRSAQAAPIPRPGSNEVLVQGNTDVRAGDTGIAQTGRAEVRSAADLNTHVPGAIGTPLIDPDEERSTRVDADVRSDDEGGVDSERTAPQSDQVGRQLGTDAVTFMELRWSATTTATPEPIRRDMEAFNDHPMGELHFFGAPLAVRTKSSTGERSASEIGSIVGLDYRVRTSHFSWATGIHYGSYALTGDQGATDVKLNFVEVPLLASYQLSRRRFGVSLQGGLSMDLLFNSRGRYPVEGNGSGAAVPDDAFRTVNCSWLLRPQVTYHVADRLSVNAGPLWKAQIGEVANAGPLAGAHVSSSGISIGITWRLDRSTF